MMRNTIAGFLIGIAAVAVLIVAMGRMEESAVAAPAMAPTPAPVTRPSSPGYAIYTLFNARSISSTTTSTCYDVGRHSTVDALFVIDQGTVNTVTLHSMWSIDGTTLITGAAIASAVAVDTSDMQQLQVFGRYFCVRAAVANTHTVVVTVQGMAK